MLKTALVRMNYQISHLLETSLFTLSYKSSEWNKWCARAHTPIHTHTQHATLVREAMFSMKREDGTVHVEDILKLLEDVS